MRRSNSRDLLTAVKQPPKSDATRVEAHGELRSEQEANTRVDVPE